MAKICGADGMSMQQLQLEINQGGRFVQYIWCISVVLMTFKRASDIYYIPPGNNTFLKGLPFTLVTLLLGWWGIPWGPIYTLECSIKNTIDGIDLTQEVMRHLTSPEH